MKRKKKEHFSSFGLVSGSEGRKQILERERERESNFSLDFPAFDSSVLVGARGEVGLCCKGYAWTPISWSFDNSGR